MLPPPPPPPKRLYDQDAVFDVPQEPLRPPIAKRPAPVNDEFEAYERRIGLFMAFVRGLLAAALLVGMALLIWWVIDGAAEYRDPEPPRTIPPATG